MANNELNADKAMFEAVARGNLYACYSFSPFGGGQISEPPRTYLDTKTEAAWQLWQLSAARPAQGGLSDALPVIRDLDAIGMALAARLAAIDVKFTKGERDYLLRDSVMREVVEWRRQWDKNSAARPDFAAVARGQQGGRDD